MGNVIYSLLLSMNGELEHIFLVYFKTNIYVCLKVKAISSSFWLVIKICQKYPPLHQVLPTMFPISLATALLLKRVSRHFNRSSKSMLKSNSSKQANTRSNAGGNVPILKQGKQKLWEKNPIKIGPTKQPKIKKWRLTHITIEFKKII